MHKNHPKNKRNCSEQNKITELRYFENTKLTVASTKKEIEEDERNRQRDGKKQSLNGSQLRRMHHCEQLTQFNDLGIKLSVNCLCSQQPIHTMIEKN